MLDYAKALIRWWRMKTHKPFGRTSSDALRISLGDMKPEIAIALATAFAGADQVEVVEGNLLDLACDAIVSPANSFGDMGGGIDKAIDDFHRGAAQRALRGCESFKKQKNFFAIVGFNILCGLIGKGSRRTDDGPECFYRFGGG